jgi:hypothetical protein
VVSLVDYNEAVAQKMGVCTGLLQSKLIHFYAVVNSYQIVKKEISLFAVSGLLEVAH